jgi:hypothetical protein
MSLPLSALSAYSEEHRSRPRIGSDQINGQDLEFQWSYDRVLKIAEAFKAYDPAPPTEKINGVFDPRDIVPDQPVWDLNAKPGGKDEAREEQDRKFSESRNEKSNHLGWRQRDPIAWYCPASFFPPEKYGIHFDAAKVRRLALNLEKHDPSASITQDEWLVAAIVKIFWHEICHGWVEDLCHLVESLNGENHYKEIQIKLTSYVFMEEALCNTVALWMLKFFFQSHKQKDVIFASVIDFMKSQPKGYRDFRNDMPQWPGQSDWISKNLRKFMVKVYGFQSCEAVRHAVNVFLEPPFEWYAPSSDPLSWMHRSIHPRGFKYRHFPRLTELYRYARNYPVFIE